MHELRTCDSCGTDVVDVSEVLPPALTPVDDQRRVVLCEHCKETLGKVIAPLLSRLGVDAGVDVADDARAEIGASATLKRTTSGLGGETTSVDVNAVDPAPTPPEPADYDSPSEGDDTGSLGDDANDNDDVDDEAEVETETETRTKTENKPSISTADKQPRPDGESGRGEKPPKFRRIIRVLQNRESPVERTEVEALTSGAYDPDDDEVADILDCAIERGLLVGDSGTLQRS